MKKEKLDFYVKEDEMYSASMCMLFIARAYADNVTILSVSAEQLHSIAVTFDVKADWDMKVFGMDIEIFKS